MAADEGVRRVKLLGRTMTIGGIGSAVILFAFFTILRGSNFGINLLPLVVVLGLIGGALWILGWVLEGFLGSPE
jgi:hypothetical protein